MSMIITPDTLHEQAIRFIYNFFDVSPRTGEIPMNARLLEDLGADELDVIDLVIDLEKQFMISIPDNQIPKIKTVQDILDCVLVGYHLREERNTQQNIHMNQLNSNMIMDRARPYIKSLNTLDGTDHELNTKLTNQAKEIKELKEEIEDLKSRLESQFQATINNNNNLF